MNVTIAVDDEGWHAIPALERMVGTAIDAAATAAGLSAGSGETAVLLTSDDEIRLLNRHWRGKDQATNVLSFPTEEFPLPPGEAKPLGDIVLAFDTVSREAANQGKSLPDHATHLIVHGFLHLLGFDHEDEDGAREMEKMETRVLNGLGIADPYE
jgi:probable rRNA maturation factor